MHASVTARVLLWCAAARGVCHVTRRAQMHDITRHVALLLQPLAKA
jgi:hypothetical protein